MSEAKQTAGIGTLMLSVRFCPSALYNTITVLTPEVVASQMLWFRNGQSVNCSVSEFPELCDFNVIGVTLFDRIMFNANQ